MRILDRGVTGLNGRGMYTNNDKEVLFCVVSKNIQTKDIVRVWIQRLLL